MPKARSKTKGSRIGHAIRGTRAELSLDDAVDRLRGWIRPSGEFLGTRNHWDAISGYLGRKGAGDPELGERNAHHAYGLGWISLGHGGAMNAIGHRRTFDSAHHPAVATLRKLVADHPNFILRIELQRGALDPESGRHEDFDVSEYELNLFVKHGKLRKS